ncbi:MAG TPA: hypothetical protein IAB96_00100 [Candidatus Coprenecus pullicola]|nr:hypothetical protein [Candidatus Coprenecus pullicola]
MAGLACLSLYSCEEKNPETPDTPDTPVVPTISISLSEARETAIDFTLTPANAESVAWQIMETGETVPTAEEILASGHSAGTESATYTADGLTPETSYVLAAAAANGDLYSSVATLEVTTLAEGGDEVIIPTVAIESVRPKRDGLTFTYTQEDAEAIAYVVVGRSEAIPHADEILQTGTQVDLSQSEVVVEDLTPNTSYILAMAAQSGSAYSEVQSEFPTTLFEYQIDEDIELTFTSVSIDGVSESDNGVNRFVTTFTTDEGAELTTVFYADLVDGSPATGTYNVVSTGNSEAFDIIAGNVSSGGGQFTFVQVDDSNLGAVEGGSMEIAADNISFNFVINQYYTLSGSYAGKITAPSSTIGSNMTGDILNVTFNTTEFGTTFTLSTWANDPEMRINIAEKGDNAGFKKGDEFRATFFIDNNNGVLPDGTYTVGKELESGTFIDYADGTYLIIKEPGASERINAPAASGTVTVSTEENGDRTVSFDLRDDLGHRFTGSYTGQLQ